MPIRIDRVKLGGVARPHALALTAMILSGVAAGEASAQYNADLCRQRNTTILVVRLETGFRLNMILKRTGDTITGRVVGWQSTGVMSSRGSVSGVFGGTAPAGRGLVLEVRWDRDQSGGAQNTFYKGFLHRGRGDGTALDLATSRQVNASAMTARGCPTWPEVSSLPRSVRDAARDSMPRMR